jgi:hypothetical protein
MEPNFASKEEIESLKKWASMAAKPSPKQQKLSSNLRQSDWEFFSSPRSPYVPSCNSCRRIR